MSVRYFSICTSSFRFVSFNCSLYVRITRIIRRRLRALRTDETNIIVSSNGFIR